MQEAAMKKKLFLLACACLSAAVLVGCQSTPATGNAGTDAGSAEQSTAQNDTDFYAVATTLPRQEVERYAQKVKAAILDSDWTKLSEFVFYPITMGGVTYADSASFQEAPFDKLFDASFLEALRAESCEKMFCNASGVMLGNGEVWIAELLNENLKSQGLRVIAINASGTADSQAQAATFKSGTWLAYGGGEYTYYFFDTDGISGRTVRQSDGTGLGFTYEAQGNDVTFHMGSADSFGPETLQITDREHITLQWKGGIAEELTYVSDDTSETFSFYSDQALCELALQYAKAHADSKEALTKLSAACAVNSDGTVSIQVYENLNDHNSTYAWYTVNRYSAEGTNDTTGETVYLASRSEG